MTDTSPPLSNARPRGPIAAVIAVVLHEGRTLLVRRANPPDAGLWGFPGGKIEPGETIANAAIRELLEETGVHGEALHPFTALDAFDCSANGDISRHFILVAVLCRLISGEPVAADDALEAAWFATDNLVHPDLPLSRDVIEVAQQAIGIMRGQFLKEC
ncbi:NUDIX hydrolase [Pseudochelatococcus contaminans]|uniref:ADP-ribose pyrophosphatase YjhB (NUDIX family) n=1 Tax=Pseudochelatococcus contaminans TaxID=1538103 RepID=A0A7W6EGQ5_9HYPH|nr:NUDIX hydrolase [Pseudochelatococcus contaminans]MBB3809182.1 ADP-ribose pyrophosphatase YjhB (NUDIX family) [Pseudochelatococcus contaminans]